MTELRLYDTLAREKRVFEPADPNRVTMYVCGPTVYNRAHIGNARPAVVFDVLARLLRHRYGADKLVYARNVTDVDDKIIQSAADEGVDPAVITARYEQHYLDDMGALGVAPPDIAPHATEHVPDMIAMIARLIETGNAYQADGHVLFHVPSDPGYGALGRRDRDATIAGARVEVAAYKKDPADFVLWKPSPDGVIGWESPWGRGRPGWHIECSAMIERHLGKRSTSTPAASISSSPTMKTSSPRAAAPTPARRSPAIGCTTASSAWRAPRRCRRASAMW
jgi:cysteinyl-tRNA synthetase